MNILVCVKQVPDTTEIRIDPVKHTLIRDGVPSIVNTFDTYALEMAVRLKEDRPGSVVSVLTMGPPQAEEAIRTCLSLGADNGYLVSGREFSGSDTLATSYILKCSIEYIERTTGAKFDLILCGKQAMDGDTAQVGPELSEHLKIPLVTYASDIWESDGEIRVKRENDDGYDIIGVQMPCLITVVKTAFEPRRATILSKIAACRRNVPVIGAAQMEGMIDLTRCGLNGSPTKVKKTMTPERNIHCMFIEGAAADQAEQLLLKLKEKEIL